MPAVSTMHFQLQQKKGITANTDRQTLVGVHHISPLISLQIRINGFKIYVGSALLHQVSNVIMVAERTGSLNEVDHSQYKQTNLQSIHPIHASAVQTCMTDFLKRCTRLITSQKKKQTSNVPLVAGTSTLAVGHLSFEVTIWNMYLPLDSVYLLMQACHRKHFSGIGQVTWRSSTTFDVWL